MAKEDLKLSNFSKIVANLAELHQWELQNFPLMESLTGRLLYFRMVSRAVNSPDQACQSLKNLVSDTGYTDKAIRSRLQKMEEDGYIELVQSDADTRSKYAVPTPLFQAAVYLHAEQMRRIFAKDFLLIEKNDR